MITPIPPTGPPDVRQPPPPMAGFEGLERYWDGSNEHWICKILPGEVYVSRHAEFISTVLGSCVSACIYDLQNEIGGMNHFMLPESNTNHNIRWGDDKNSAMTRFGAQAMEFLLQTILQNGGAKQNLEVKLFGGGRILNSMADIGLKNIDFAEHYLQQNQLPLVSKDVGEPYPRRILFDPRSGRVWVKKLRALYNNTIMVREENYQQVIKQITTGA